VTNFRVGQNIKSEKIVNSETIPPSNKKVQYGSGDSYLIEDVFDEKNLGENFYLLKQEVDWQQMFNRENPVPRKVAVQGDIDKEGVIPLYRHPADEEPPLQSWTPTIDKFRKQAEELLVTKFNHALIQYYVDGSHWIGRHSDKTLDITRGTDICGASFGATRVLLVRDKTSDEKGVHLADKIALPNNSLFVIGWETNRKCQHLIKKDLRDKHLKSPDELAFEGGRISITFRSVSTFMLPDRRIYGQGAVCKNRSELESKPESNQVKCDDEDVMLKAFGTENKDSNFDWDQHYQQGFDAINFKMINTKS
jgi:hypothetical protein